jgi:predicted Ser/Thr protein kinase
MGMSNTSPKCPQCGAPLPENAPAGLCPNCLMALNLKTETVFTGDAPTAQPPLPPEQIAPHFPQLEILECLGRGGMGVVYKARQKILNRLVALKLLVPERVGDAKFAERFTREAQALAALNHPNIVTIHDFGQAGGFYFLLMEFVDGVNLRQLLRTRKFTPEEALAIVPPLCDALQFAHERGIVHRDIKPENLLLDKAGRVKVADFGIAKMLGTENGDRRSESAAPANATQNAVGTPGYSAPEQKSDPQRVDSRADIYSLGVVLYEMLTGELPGKKIEAPSRKVHIDVRLDEVVLRALEKTPELRWQTASDLRTQVETITQTFSSEIPTRGAITPAYLNGYMSGMRWRILVWGLALVAAGVSMNFAFGFFGASVFVVSGTLALFFPNDLKLLIIACRLVLIDGIVMASASIWFAFNTESLKIQWMVPIVAGCLLGIGYCVSRWFKLDVLNSEIQNAPLAMPARLKKIFLIQLPVALVITFIIRRDRCRRAGNSARQPFPRLETHAQFRGRRPHCLPARRFCERGSRCPQRQRFCAREPQWRDQRRRDARRHFRTGGQRVLARGLVGHFAVEHAQRGQR